MHLGISTEHATAGADLVGHGTQQDTTGKCRHVTQTSELFHYSINKDFRHFCLVQRAALYRKQSTCGLFRIQGSCLYIALLGKNAWNVDLDIVVT